MHVSERQVNDVTVIDVGTGARSGLVELVKAVLQRGDRRLVLNVGQLGAVDSTCLGEIFASYKATLALGGVLRLAHPDAHLRRVLQVTKLDTFIGIFDTEEEAIASFGKAGSRVS